MQGGLGQGIGVALGVKLADPAREVALTVGDGSFLYNPIVQSLSAAKTRPAAADPGVQQPAVPVHETQPPAVLPRRRVRAEHRLSRGGPVRTARPRRARRAVRDARVDPERPVADLREGLERCAPRAAAGVSAVLTVHVSRCSTLTPTEDHTDEETGMPQPVRVDAQSCARLSATCSPRGPRRTCVDRGRHFGLGEPARCRLARRVPHTPLPGAVRERPGRPAANVDVNIHDRLRAARRARRAGPVAMARANEAVAALGGHAWAAVRGTVHTGAIGYYTRTRRGRHGRLGLVAGVPNMAYLGTNASAVATSPLSVAVPTGPATVLLDMATAVIALGRSLRSKRGHGTCTGRRAHEGRRTNLDPAEAAIPLPVGGAKGAGMCWSSRCSRAR